MIGNRAHDRSGGLNNIETAHLLRPRRIPARRIVSAITNPPRGGGEQIAVDREDDIGLVKMRDQFQRLAIGQDGAAHHIVPADRLPLMPARLGILRKHSLKLTGQGWRADGSSQDA